MANSQRICVLSKLVHASERQWCRLVIPGAVQKLWHAMQKELQAQGNDFQIFVTDSTGTHAWCWGVRMMVQRPMLLELAAFYNDMDVHEGDTVLLYRDISTNQLIVDIQRNPDATAAAAANSAAGPSASAAALSRATSSANAYTASAAAALAARRLPGQVWTAHVHKAARLNVVGRRRSPAHSEEEGEEGEDGDWSPTARLGGRGGRGSGGPLPLRRRLEVLPPKAHLSVALAGTSSNSDEDSSCVVYTAEQTRRFDALVDVAARVIEPQPPAADA